MIASIHGEQLDLWRGEHHVLAGLDVQANSGDLLLLTGANGSGKTTLLRTLCGLLQPEAGRVLWAGQDIRKDLPGYHAQVVYLGHEPPLKADLTAHENLRFWVGIRRALTPDEIRAALHRVGASTWSDRPVRTLSAGQRRRVALSGLILCASALWLLDEPTTNLDVEGQRLVANLIEERIGSGGIVIAAVHQDLPFDRAPTRRIELVCA
jgi:heme exporter protein A